ncbi:MAG: class I SAM-dependent methyltransferase [Actinobacteria bacterium]|nr:class I SAM-dependent methyltransferase [Chloroflexota bacterium]MBE3129038.1 class I SAM-dependent methyltransferase [Actinomycetota bacterium]
MVLKIKSLVQKLTRIFEYKIILISKNSIEKKLIIELPADMDEGFKEVYEKCKDYTMTSIERMYALYKAVEYIVNLKIPGDFVECGVWKGGSSMVMAYTLLKMKETNRKIYLYDTFRGMTKPTEKDRRISDSLSMIEKWGKLQRNNYTNWAFSSLNEVKNNMSSTGYPLKKIVYIEGKVEDTIPSKVPSHISLLRLDTDWYESTYHELNYLFPLLTKGGVLIIDDYGYWAGAKEAVDKYFGNKNIVILLNRIDQTGRLGIKL